MLQPLPGFALIELPTKYESGLQTEKEKYAMRSEGILIRAIYKNETQEAYNIYKTADKRTVYFAPFEDGEVIKHEDKEYVFVPVKSLRGVK